MTMTIPGSLAAEHHAWQWDLVLQYENGSLPPRLWNEDTLTVITSWYAKHISREVATTRYEKHYHRTRRRLLNRLGSATVATDAIDAVDKVWESLLTRAYGDQM
jgi:hypothetical protein